MSEREEEFLNKAEAVLKGLEKTKKFYQSIVLAFAGSIIIFVAGAFVGNYRLKQVETGLKQAASIKAIELLNQKYEAQTDALINLIDKDYQEAAREFNDECKKIYENIFMYSTEIQRGGRK